MDTFARISLIVVLVLSAATYSWAGPPTDQVRAYTDQVLKVLQSQALTLPARRAAVGQIASEAFAVSETAQRALGVHWQQRTPAEREEFVKLFANLLEQTYVSRIDQYGGERIAYLGEQIDGDRAIVRARIETRDGIEVLPVESRLLLKDNRWFIYDIVIANMSLISNYRAQFERVIRTASFEDLVRRLQGRIGLLNGKETKNGKETNAARATAPVKQ
jgi:phospholipid transport system substrate-binding protein